MKTIRSLCCVLTAVGMLLCAVSCENNFSGIFGRFIGVNGSPVSSETQYVQASRESEPTVEPTVQPTAPPEELPDLQSDLPRQQDISDPTVALQGISFRFASAVLNLGSSSRLRYDPAPNDADTSDLKWMSSAPEIISVSNRGKVTANSGGSATITVYSETYDVKTTCVIHVRGEAKEPTHEDIAGEDPNESGYFTPPEPTDEPTPTSTAAPTVTPTVAPTVTPTVEPTPTSTVTPTVAPTVEPTVEPTPSVADELIRVRQPNGTYAVMTLLDFVSYEVGTELNSSFGDEAIKAQAVAVYTYYVAYNMSGGAKYATSPQTTVAIDPATGEVDYSEVVDQFPVKDGSFARLRSLCRSVAGQAALYNNKPICAVFSASNRGVSQCNSPYWSNYVYPYLVRVDSPWDTVSPKWETKKTVSKETMRETILSLAPEAELAEDPAVWFDEIERDVPDEGYVLYVTFGNKTVTGGKIRSKFGLRSSCFFVSYDAETETFTFTVHGYGHGIGMSQWGAYGMAKDGYTYDQIITHYYQGTTVGYYPPRYIYEGSITENIVQPAE